MELEIEVLSDYLYVGSGEFGLFKLQGREQAYYAFARRNGRLIIPGTGIKGAVRSIVEAISNSCVRQSARGEKVPHSHEACQDESALCPACRLFGTTGYRGRVHFSDAMPVEEVKPEIVKIADLWPPRLAKGRKFYQAKTFQKLDMQPEKSHRFIEVVPRGSRFQTILHFENATAAEMGLVVRAIGLEQKQDDASKVVYAVPVKLGGAKPRCLGAVRFRPRRLFLISAGPGIFSELLTGGSPASLTDNLRAWLQDHSLLDQDAWELFRQEAKQRGEPCPKEVY
ncbi:MAG: RAMP superfamily CRISPR-associated protein [Anaerolineae bacterium]